MTCTQIKVILEESYILQKTLVLGPNITYVLKEANRCNINSYIL